MAGKKLNPKFFICVLLFFVALISKETEQSLSSDIAAQINSSRKALSRRKRYLIFPQGSSLQLVYCLTIPIIGYKTIFTIGGTAALAWQLPHEPYRRLHRKHQDEDSAEERVDTPEASSSGGWTLQDPHKSMADEYKNSYSDPFVRQGPPTVYYHTIKYDDKSPIVNSAAYQQSIRRKYAYNHPVYQTIKGPDYNKSNKRFNEPVTSYLDPIYHQVHRRTKRDLYSKIEKFFEAQKKDGRACLLKAICQVSQTPRDNSGSFIEEIMKAIFRYKPHDNYENEDDYDHAYNKRHNCTEKYPTCNSSVWNIT